MRWDVLYLILGWTVGALTVPLALVGIATAFLMTPQMALIAFLPSTLLAMGSSWLMLRYGTTPETPDRLRDREAFATVALAYPVVVAFGAMPFGWAACFMVHLPLTSPFLPRWKASSILGLKRCQDSPPQGRPSSTCPPHRIASRTPKIASAPSRVGLLWRSTMQWLGGMGVIMLSMVVLFPRFGRWDGPRTGRIDRPFPLSPAPCSRKPRRRCGSCTSC